MSRARELLGKLSGRLGFRPPRSRGRTTLDCHRIDDDLALGSSPTIGDIERLARKAGFRTILNLNMEGEPGQILSPNVEATWAHTFEMQHERVSIDLGLLLPERVDRFLETLRASAKPIFVHSLGGRRAAALTTIHLALARRIPGSEALAAAKALGIDCELESLRRFAVSEVDRRTRHSAPDAPNPTGRAGHVTTDPAPARDDVADVASGAPGSSGGGLTRKAS